MPLGADPTGRRLNPFGPTRINFRLRSACDPSRPEPGARLRPGPDFDWEALPASVGLLTGRKSTQIRNPAACGEIWELGAAGAVGTGTFGNRVCVGKDWFGLGGAPCVRRVPQVPERGSVYRNRASPTFRRGFDLSGLFGERPRASGIAERHRTGRGLEKGLAPGLVQVGGSEPEGTQRYHGFQTGLFPGRSVSDFRLRCFV